MKNRIWGEQSGELAVPPAMGAPGKLSAEQRRTAQRREKKRREESDCGAKAFLVKHRVFQQGIRQNIGESCLA